MNGPMDQMNGPTNGPNERPRLGIRLEEVPTRTQVSDFDVHDLRLGNLEPGLVFSHTRTLHDSRLEPRLTRVFFELVVRRYNRRVKQGRRR